MEERQAGPVAVRFVAHGRGVPVLVLHGAGVDHREAEACFDPALDGFRRIYPDLPGMGATAAPEAIRSGDDVLDVLLAFADAVVPEGPFLLVGHSAGAFFAQGIAARRSDRVRGLALVCPLLPDLRDVPSHRPVVADPRLGDAGFRDYFVVQTPAMLDRYERYVAPALPLVDEAAMARIGERWALSGGDGPPYAGAMLVVAGRRDATVGWAAAADLASRHPRATLAVLDGAGHALPHEQPQVLAALLRDWLARTG